MKTPQHPVTSRRTRDAQGRRLERMVLLLFQLETEEEALAQRRKQLWAEAGKEMRAVRGRLSLRHAAKLLGISAPYLSDMELGRRNPSIGWIQKLFTIIQHNKKGQP